MAEPWTLTEAQAQLDAWKDCSLKVAQGQSYTIGDRTLTRANAAWIAEQIRFWGTEVRRLGSGSSGIITRGVTPRMG